MSDELQRNSFEGLVAGISSDEKKYLLDKINNNKEKQMPLLQSVRDEEDYNSVEIKLAKESMIYRFFIWLRTLITKKSKLEVYNMDLVDDLMRKINRKHPGCLDVRNGLLQSLFYEKLRSLKEAADFFKPYLIIANENPGKFYVFLSSLITPEVQQKIDEVSDPYQTPFEREASQELRTSLVKRMDSVLKDMPGISKKVLYNNVQSLNWLDRFCGLQYTHFLAQFTAVVSESYTCPFTNAQLDYPAFASVLSDAKPIPNEALEALLLYSLKVNSNGNEPSETNNEKVLREYMAKAASHVSMIQLFISTIPLEAMGKVIFGDYDWQISSSGGGEDWFLKFKEEWKVIFDGRWENWLRDKKKAELSAILKEKFGIDQFPEIPYRPWAKLWGGVLFRCELTGGFLTWFASNLYDEIINILNILCVEGIFINNENRAEFSEAMNDFQSVNQEVLSFIDSISERGQIGNVFQQIFDEHIRSLKSQQTIDNIILNAENSVRTWERLFCESARTMERIFHGIFDETKDKGYESIQNLMTIHGHENAEYRQKLLKTRDILLQCRTILAQVEPLDLPKPAEKKGKK